MALINHAKREINAKIVYYGQEGVGKRASLKYLYDRIKPSLRGELKTVSASGDSLLFFDFSPFENPLFGGYRIRLHMYSLVGVVTNPAAWKMTLKGADGVVIVADAAPEMMPATRECISNLRGALSAYGVGLHDLPCILQVNRGASTASSSGANIAAELDLPGMRTCFSTDGSGEGVLEGLSHISRDILTRIGQDDSLRDGERKPVPETAREEVGAATPEAHDLENPSTASGLVGLPAEGASLNLEKHSVDSDGCEQVVIALAGSGAVCSEGAVQVPLDITIAGISRRFVVSIAIEQV